MMQIETYPDREMLAMNVADRLATELEAAVQHGDFASFAVPGGSTPGPMFDFLSALRLDWSDIHVLLTDERWVPEDHPRSNTGLIRKRLLTGAAAEAKLVPLYSEGDIAEQVPRLSVAIEKVTPISVLVLGMGDDMHTASLFPGAPGLLAALEADAPALNIIEPADQPEKRVSLSAQVLNGALSKHLIITGESKRAALEKAVHMSPEDAPIRAVMTDLTVHWAE